MINLLIWSKDRACQLDLLLRSLPQSNVPQLFNKITVVYKATTESFEDGYKLLKKRYAKKSSYSNLDVDFQREGVFHALTMDNFSRERLEGNKLALSTDDTVFFKLPEITAEEIEKSFENDVITFSFRYGFNTTLQNCHTGEMQPALNIYEERTNYIRWRFDDYHPLHNYGYPFGLDMHVYDADMLWQLASSFSFKNTNQLETNLFHIRNIVPRIVCSEKHSSAVNIPCNNMSGITIAGKEYAFSIETLNEKFLSGEQIRLESVHNIEVKGCHQEFDLTFEKS